MIVVVPICENLKLNAIESSITHSLFGIFYFYIAILDFESNCGDTDDELKMFENTPETKRLLLLMLLLVVVLVIGLNVLVLVVKEFIVMLGKMLLLRKFRVIPLRTGIIMKRLV